MAPLPKPGSGKTKGLPVADTGRQLLSGTTTIDFKNYDFSDIPDSQFDLPAGVQISSFSLPSGLPTGLPSGLTPVFRPTCPPGIPSRSTNRPLNNSGIDKQEKGAVSSLFLQLDVNGQPRVSGTNPRSLPVFTIKHKGQRVEFKTFSDSTSLAARAFFHPDSDKPQHGPQYH